MAWNIAETQKGKAASASTRGSGKIMLGWTYSSEGKKKSRKKGQRESQKTEDWGEEAEEEEDIGVPPTTPRWDTRGKGHPFGESWRISSHGIQTQGNHCWRWGGVIAF